MLILEIALAAIVGYVALLLLLEAVIWKTQPNMERLCPQFFALSFSER